MGSRPLEDELRATRRRVRRLRLRLWFWRAVAYLRDELTL